MKENKIINLYKQNFAPRIKQARIDNNLTLREAAEKLGINNSTLASYEAERTEPGLEMMGKLAVLYCHTVDYFLGLADD